MVAPGLGYRFEGILTGDQEPIWTAPLGLKDATLVTDLAAHGLERPLTTAGHDQYAKAGSRWGKEDVASVAKLYDEGHCARRALRNCSPRRRGLARDVPSVRSLGRAQAFQVPVGPVAPPGSSAAGISKSCSVRRTGPAGSSRCGAPGGIPSRAPASTHDAVGFSSPRRSRTRPERTWRDPHVKGLRRCSFRSAAGRVPSSHVIERSGRRPSGSSPRSQSGQSSGSPSRDARSASS
jgi:hypothetical protein